MFPLLLVTVSVLSSDTAVVSSPSLLTCSFISKIIYLSLHHDCVVVSHVEHTTEPQSCSVTGAADDAALLWFVNATGLHGLIM